MLYDDLLLPHGAWTRMSACMQRSIMLDCFQHGGGWGEDLQNSHLRHCSRFPCWTRDWKHEPLQPRQRRREEQGRAAQNEKGRHLPPPGASSAAEAGREGGSAAQTREAWERGEMGRR
ncbi:hypothetical protein PVAP13_5NG248081 [Panicum virgatum]|uniref:Uncharacterized protein n=1 Tax=Panicum virgatum TaxID=38727 RepID=A0A8T0RWU0_PANVG|nr:hypothetical protein PVAP13_5NG248081 [Panicum virgatum]